MARPLHQAASRGPVGDAVRIPRSWSPPPIQLRRLVTWRRQSRRRRRRRRRHRKLVAMKRIGPGGTWKLGFTLIELMVVIVLLGILAAMIIPEMKGTYQDAMLRSASRELVSV